MPSPAEIRINKTGETACFFIFLKIRAVRAISAKIIIALRSGVILQPIDEKLKSALKSIIMPADRIIAAIHGLIPSRNDCTAPYLRRFFRINDIIRIITNDGRTTPNVADSAPRIPPCEEPINVAMLMARGPGVDSETAIKFIS